MPDSTIESPPKAPTVEADRDDERIRATALQLLGYCRERNWAGYDPYDALNSGLFQALPILDRKPVRLVMTQLLKRSPLNFRPLLGVPPRQNAKGLSLFVCAVLKLARSGVIADATPARELADRLLEMRSEEQEHACWGYSFAWQTRSRLVPEGSPNLVCTTFVANALLDAYAEFKDPRYADAAKSAAEYILEELFYRSDDGTVSGFAYPLPTMRQEIHNANFLAAALLARVAAQCGEERFLPPATDAVQFSAGKQRDDGSWLYGETGKYGWIDNFHTGFNLCALRDFGRYAGTDCFEGHIERGFDYYRSTFFRDDGAPKYFHDRVYPIDAHCVAQALITLETFKDLDPDGGALAAKVFSWAMDAIWSPEGYFYYRVYRHGKNRIPYMRWTEAWMLLALAEMIESSQ